MPIRTALWKVGAKPQALTQTTLATEQLLEEMIVSSPTMLSDEWMLIGRQEDTGYGGRIDLLAIAPDASLVLIELKRDRTPREVVAQALDYASWVDKLLPQDIVAIYKRFAPKGDLAEDFRSFFNQDLDEDSLNQGHQIVIVAAALDDSTERIIGYLNERDIAINVLCFQVFNVNDEQLLSRAWLIDPSSSPSPPATKSDGKKEPWNGEFYVSYGHDASRSWEDARKFGFISAGGGSWYSKTLQLLSPGDRVWVKVPGSGFVGVGKVTGRRQPASSFTVTTPAGERPILEVAKQGQYHRDLVDDSDRCEYFVPVQWYQTVPLESAVHEIGLFGNQNTVCKPTTPKWRFTIERLKERFPNHGGA